MPRIDATALFIGSAQWRVGAEQITPRNATEQITDEKNLASHTEHTSHHLITQDAILESVHRHIKQ